MDYDTEFNSVEELMTACGFEYPEELDDELTNSIDPFRVTGLTLGVATLYDVVYALSAESGLEEPIAWPVSLGWIEAAIARLSQQLIGDRRSADLTAPTPVAGAQGLEGRAEAASQKSPTGVSTRGDRTMKRIAIEFEGSAVDARALARAVAFLFEASRVGEGCTYVEGFSMNSADKWHHGNARISITEK